MLVSPDAREMLETRGLGRMNDCEKISSRGAWSLLRVPFAPLNTKALIIALRKLPRHVLTYEFLRLISELREHDMRRTRRGKVTEFGRDRAGGHRMLVGDG